MTTHPDRSKLETVFIAMVKTTVSEMPAELLHLSSEWDKAVKEMLEWLENAGGGPPNASE